MMGNTGGRSRGNRTGRGASYRATERERSLVDNPRTASWETVDEEGLHEPMQSTLEKWWVGFVLALFVSLWLFAIVFLAVRLAT